MEINDCKNYNTFKVNGQKLKPFLEYGGGEDFVGGSKLCKVSLAEDIKLSTCGRHSSFFSL
jgi:hypothetical protein